MTRFLVLLALVGCAGAPDASTCTTGEAWTGGDEESPLMHPGLDCIACHEDEGEGPLFSAAGTVMPAFDEPDDCFGVEGVTVRLVDADGGVHETTTNAAGNFSFSEEIPTPYTAEIEADGVVSPMSTPQTDGACASCHTVEGLEGAPGRIFAP